VESAFDRTSQIQSILETSTDPRLQAFIDEAKDVISKYSMLTPELLSIHNGNIETAKMNLISKMIQEKPVIMNPKDCYAMLYQPKTKRNDFILLDTEENKHPPTKDTRTSSESSTKCTIHISELIPVTKIQANLDSYYLPANKSTDERPPNTFYVKWVMNMRHIVNDTITYEQCLRCEPISSQIQLPTILVDLLPEITEKIKDMEKSQSWDL